MGALVATLAGDHDVVAVLDLLAALGVAVVAVAAGRGGRGGACVLGALVLVAVAVVTVQLGHLVHLDGGLGGMLHVDVDDVGAERWRRMGGWRGGEAFAKKSTVQSSRASLNWWLVTRKWFGGCVFLQNMYIYGDNVRH